MTEETRTRWVPRSEPPNGWRSGIQSFVPPIEDGDCTERVLKVFWYDPAVPFDRRQPGDTMVIIHDKVRERRTVTEWEPIP